MKISRLRACAGVAVVLGAASAHAAISITYVAASGTDGPLGPGMGAGVMFTGFQPPLHAPSINAAGQVGFRGIANLAGGSQGGWVHSGGGNSNIAIAGGSVPGGGTFNTGSAGVFGTVTVNSGGDWTIRGTGTTAGVIASLGGVPMRGVVSPDVAPGTGPTPAQSTTFSGSSSPLLNNLGQLGVIGTLATSATSVPATVTTAGIANNSGLYIGQPGAMSLALRQNDTVASIDAGGAARLGAFNTNNHALNHAGRYVVQNTLQGTVNTGTGAGSNNVAIVSNRNGFVEKLARVGDAAPDSSGNPSADLYRSFSNVGLGFNNAGRVVIQGTLRDAAGAQTSTGSIFTDAGTGVMRQVARASTALPSFIGETPGEFAGVTWGTPSNAPSINASDTVVFTSALTGAPAGFGNLLLTMQNVAGTDQYRRIARSGDVVAPGAALNSFNSVGATAINVLGQLVFQATLTGSGVTASSDSAIFGWDPTAGLIMVAREGDLLPNPLGPGTKTIASFGSMSPVGSGGEDGRVSNLASNGKLAFTVVFTDGTEAVCSAMIPAPGSLALLGLAGVVASRRRR